MELLQLFFNSFLILIRSALQLDTFIYLLIVLFVVISVVAIFKYIYGASE